MRSSFRLQSSPLRNTDPARTLRRRGLLVLSLLTALLACVPPANGTPLPTTASQASPSLDASNVRSSTDLLRAALEASGETDPKQIHHYLSKFAELAQQLSESIPARSAATEQAQSIVEFLHERILTGGYDATCHDPRCAFDTGRFNCVGSSLLFQCLANHCGLDVRAVLVTGHVWCRVRAARGDFDVETTSRGWRVSAAPIAEFGATLATSRELDAQGLVALVYYNRSVVALRAGEFAEAATTARATLELDPNSELARENLAATYNNWAVARAEDHDFQGALALLSEARKIAPHDDRLTANARRLYARSYEAHLSTGNLASAAKLVAAAEQEFPQDDFFTAAQRTLFAQTLLLRFAVGSLPTSMLILP